MSLTAAKLYIFAAVCDLFHRLVYLWNLDVRQGIDKFGVIQGVIGSAGLENLGLLLEGEVGVGIVWIHVLLVQVQHLVVGDGARVAEVVNTSQLALYNIQGNIIMYRKISIHFYCFILFYQLIVARWAASR